MSIDEAKRELETADRGAVLALLEADLKAKRDEETEALELERHLAETVQVATGRTSAATLLELKRAWLDAVIRRRLATGRRNLVESRFILALNGM